MSDEKPAYTCPCGGFIGWRDCGDHWEGSCFGKCSENPIKLKPQQTTT